MSEREGGLVDPNAIGMAIQAGTELVKTGKMDRSVEELDKGVSNLLRVIFSPFRALAGGADAIKQKLAERANRKLEAVREDARVIPPPSISAPLLLNYALLGPDDAAEEELRDLYAGLLASAVDGQTASKVHPSFNQILSGMTSKDAEFVKLLSKSVDTGANWEVSELIRRTSGDGYRPLFKLYYYPGRLGLDPLKAQEVVSNLIRLGLISEDFDTALTEDTNYEKIRERARKLLKDVPSSEELDFRDGCYQLTPLGIAFVKVCVR